VQISFLLVKHFDESFFDVFMSFKCKVNSMTEENEVPLLGELCKSTQTTLER
jgi:hypothetical protein